MKIWLCGSRGMLASHFARELSKRNIRFVGSDISHTDHRVNVTSLQEVLDFATQQEITHIINCAAYTQVDKAETERDLAYQVNAIGPRFLGIASKNLGLHVIHFSTDYVFDGHGNEPYKEDHPCQPVNYYGVSKWEGEKQLSEQTEKACVIRTSWLYGLSGKNFVETMLRLMQEKETLRVVADQVGRPTFCQDLVEATMRLLNTTGTYHFANSEETSWYQFAREIHQLGLEMGYQFKLKEIQPIKTEEYPTPAKRPAYSTLSTAKFENITANTPRKWKEALKDYMNQYQKSQQG